jgi:hypothetical protein
MTLRLHNLPSGLLKKRLWWSRWSDVSRFRKAMQTHFLDPGQRKKRLGLGCLSDILSRRVALTTHNLLLNVLKCNFFMSIKRCFIVFKGHFIPFSTFWALKKAIWMNSRKWCLKYANCLRKNNLPSGRLKKLIWWIRWIDVSRWWKVVRNHFLHPGHLTKRLGRSCSSNDLSRQMALRTHNLPSGLLKNDFGEVDEVIFQSVERSCELILWILGIEKINLEEVTWMMF